MAKLLLTALLALIVPPQEEHIGAIECNANAVYNAICARDHASLQQLLEQHPSLATLAIEEGSFLHIAATFGDLRTISLLIEKGSEILRQDSLGETPLHKAAQAGRIEEAEVILFADSDAALKPNKFGWIPLHFAVALGHREVAGVLSLWGGMDHKSLLSGATPHDLAYLSGDCALVSLVDTRRRDQQLSIEPWSLDVSAMSQRQPSESELVTFLSTSAITARLWSNGAFRVDIGRAVFGQLSDSSQNRVRSLIRETGIEELDDNGPALLHQKTRVFKNENVHKELASTAGLYRRDRNCKNSMHLVRLCKAFDVCEVIFAGIGAYAR